MGETTISTPGSIQTEAEMLASIDRWATEIDRLRVEMKEDQKEIDRMHQESRLALDRIEATLDRIAASR